MRTLESRRLPAAVVAVVLALCAIVGFGTGVTSHFVLRGLGFGAAPTATLQLTDTPTPTLSPSPSPTLPTTLPPRGFTLSASAAPNALISGESFTVSVLVLAADGVTPVGNAACYLQAPRHGAQPLFTQWPAPQVTTADGKAAWTLTAPSVAPGVYGLEVIAYGQHGWSYRFDTSVTVRG